MDLLKSIRYFLMPSSGHLVTSNSGLRRAVVLFRDVEQELARLTAELAAITHVATTADPAGWWIAPRGSSDPSEWICVEEMDAEAQKDTARLASVASLIRGILTSVKGAEHFTDKTADVRTWSTEDVHEFLGALKYEIGVAFKTIKDIEARAALDAKEE